MKVIKEILITLINKGNSSHSHDHLILDNKKEWMLPLFQISKTMNKIDNKVHY